MEELLVSWFHWVLRIAISDGPVARFIANIISPILAIVAFLLTQRTWRRLQTKSNEAERLTCRAEHAEEQARRQESQAVAALKEIAARKNEIKLLEDDVDRLTKGSGTVWKIRDNDPYPQYREWARDPHGAQFLTFGNLKGGVGKTTLATNFAAYASETLRKRVLLVDLDFQGSLTQSVLLSAGNEDAGASKAQNLFGSDVALTEFEASIVHVAPLMSRCWLVPSSYEFNERENQMLWEAVQRNNDMIDVRYRLAHTLHRPEIRKRFDLVIFDMPPRMTLGSVNALVASHWLAVPSVLDKLSAEAATRFLSQMYAVKTDLELDIKLAGVIGMMHRTAQRSANEELAWSNIGGELDDWLKHGYGLTEPTIPRRQAITNAAGEKIPYLDPESREVKRDHFDPLFSELSQRIGLISRQSSDQTDESVEEAALI